VKRWGIVLGLLLLAQVEVSAEQLVLPVALTYGVFRPTDGKTMETFGHRWGGLSATLFAPTRRPRWGFSFDLDFHDKERDDNDALLIVATAGVGRGLGPPRRIQPYVAARAGPFYHRLKLAGKHETGLGLNANAGLGVIFYRRAFLEARYDFFTDVEGFRFDGWSLTTGVRIFDIKIRR
jgi:hypothetical protein